MWASIAKPKSGMTISKSAIVMAYAFGQNALWGDIAMYNEAEDGPYKEFFQESGRKKLAMAAPVVVRTKEDIEADAQRIKAIVAEKEKRRESAKVAKVAMCLCGCGRVAHPNPRPDFAGHCCGWCKKHGGKKGHGEACGK